MTGSVFQRVEDLLLRHGAVFEVLRHEPVNSEFRYCRPPLPDV
jgi:hypothetical protein